MNSSPFALTGTKARELLAQRAATLADTLTKEFALEPTTAKRKVR